MKVKKTKTKKALVTGGAGFIGSHVAEAYLERGWSVTVIDNLSSGKIENVPAGAEFVEIDIRDEGIHGIFKQRGGFDVVNHHAAQMDVRASVAQPRFDADVNILGLLNLMEASKASGVGRLVFVSSGGVIYGDPSERPTPESAEKAPESPYGISKMVGEYYLRCFHLLHDFDYVALRYSNVYGPRQDPHGEAGVVAIFSNLILRDEPLTIFGDGEQTRDYVYVGDVVEANMIVSEATLSAGNKVDDRAFNVGTGNETSVNRLAELLMLGAGRSVPVKRAPARAGELERNSLRCDRLKELGWEAWVDLADGLKRTYQWIAEGAGVER